MKIEEQKKYMDAKEILKKLINSRNYYQVAIPEFTYKNLRIDLAVIDTNMRRIQGFEIKISRQDFKADAKWKLYTQFTSQLSIACPENLILPEEIEDPFGLVWVKDAPTSYEPSVIWKKKPKEFNKSDSLAWTWTYLAVLETEFTRMSIENKDLKAKQ